ncbi:hypothetical protein [Halalkalicoccus jeotgali]|uniref:hypothetical protein n=1 Tax=Halalkalicoccus jeotgali TaxID=413810 RepID=UPI000B222B37|nr:hypothetical protein [Halalkalicoccus jeotgali]
MHTAYLVHGGRSAARKANLSVGIRTGISVGTAGRDRSRRGVLDNSRDPTVLGGSQSGGFRARRVAQAGTASE